MPHGGNDWLAVTQEPTLEPEMPICDPHHHFWDLRPEHIPYQRYLLHELVADVHCGHHVRSPCLSRPEPCTARRGQWSCVPSGRSSLFRGRPPPASVACMAPTGEQPPSSTTWTLTNKLAVFTVINRSDSNVFQGI